MTSELASSVCYFAEADDAYMGFIPSFELASAVKDFIAREERFAGVACVLIRRRADPDLRVELHLMKLSSLVVSVELRRTLLRLPEPKCRSHMAALGDHVSEGYDQRTLEQAQLNASTELAALAAKVRDDGLCRFLWGLSQRRASRR